MKKKIEPDMALVLANELLLEMPKMGPGQSFRLEYCCNRGDWTASVRDSFGTVFANSESSAHMAIHSLAQNIKRHW